MEQEIWLPIKYGNGKKEISNYGNVRNTFTKGILRQFVHKNGYRHINFHISKEVGSKTFRVHRLVAEHFLPPIEGKSHVNHLDFDKLNNNISNLEWCTQLENIAHYYREKFNHIVTPEIVKYIRENIGIITPRNLAKQLKLTEGYVYGVANGIHCPNIYPELIREKRTSFPREVKKYDKSDNLLDTYKSISEAANKNNVKLSHIQRVLSGERETLKGFKYKCEGYQRHKKRSIDKLLEWKAKNKG